MAKKRAFVRYTKAGKIVPGSMIITQGSYPDGPALWAEVSTDLCCDDPGLTTNSKMKGFVRYTQSGNIVPGSLILGESYPKDGGLWRDVTIDLCCNNNPLPSNCIEFVVNTEESTTFEFQIDNGSPVNYTIDWGDSNQSSGIADPGGTTLSHEYSSSNAEYTVRVCFGDVSALTFLSFGIRNSAKILSIIGVTNLPNLVELGFQVNLLETIDVSGLLFLERLYLNENNLTSLNINNLPSLVDLYLDNNNLSGSIDLTSYPNLVQAYFSNNQLTSVNASNLLNLPNIGVSFNPNLSTLLINGSVSLLTVLASGCALTQTVVDDILVELDNNGLVLGTVNLSGGTSAIPSVTGLTAKTSLEGKSWTVLVNS